MLRDENGAGVVGRAQLVLGGHEERVIGQVEVGEQRVGGRVLRRNEGPKFFENVLNGDDKDKKKAKRAVAVTQLAERSFPIP